MLTPKKIKKKIFRKLYYFFFPRYMETSEKFDWPEGKSLYVSNRAERLYLKQSLYHGEMMPGVRLPFSYKNILKADYYCFWGVAYSKRKLLLLFIAMVKRRKILIIEDGFIRSFDIGMNGEPGLSLVVDDLGIYYNSKYPCRIEKILSSSWEISEEMLRDAKLNIKNIVSRNITKYNCSPHVDLQWIDRSKQVPLVLDQKFGDKSITDNGSNIKTFSLMLETARKNHPNTQILVKLHPDNLKGGAKGYLDSIQQENVKIIEEDVNSVSLLKQVDVVYCVSTQMGFEALMCGKKVFTFGKPFYAGWGVTNDFYSFPRRIKKRSVEEIFYVSYITCSKYFHPGSGKHQLKDLLEFFGK